MEEVGYGYWSFTSKDAGPGWQYHYRLEGEAFPDPASLLQPNGVHKASEVVMLGDFDWSDGQWRGLHLSQMIIYELHIGTFTEEGTFDAAIEKIDHLKSLGINAVEIMPVGQFPGSRNWGYDVVYPFAVQASYGGPMGLMRLVDALHGAGIAVILDVIYNHLGPEGNYLPNFGPYFTDKYQTPWGKAMNFDDGYSDGVRNYYIRNALMWFRDFHIDGLRLDAVHAIMDLGAEHFLQSLSKAVAEESNALGRPCTLIAECDLNDRKYIQPVEEGGFGLHSQWCDEFHHALHSVLTGEKSGYYSDFGTLNLMAKAYRDAYVYDGIYSSHRKKTFGSKADGLKGHQFFVFAQNHDQVGNRAIGDRLTTIISFEALKLAAGAVFVSPFIPFLFMGEEYGEKNPFLYFVSHNDPELIEAVREGRKAEFADFFKHHEAPDPQDETTFKNSRLAWSFDADERQSALFNFYQKLIRFRKDNPVLRSLSRENVSTEVFEDLLILKRSYQSNHLVCLMNFGDENLTRQNEANESWEFLLDSAKKQWLGPGSGKGPEWKPGEEITLAPESIVIYQRT